MLKDARYAVRMLTRNPVVSAVAVLSLALGIGGNSTIFSLVYSFLFSPLPFAEPESLALVWETDRKQGLDQASVAPANYLDWRERTSSFAALAAATTATVRLTGDGRPEQTSGATVTASFFSVLGVEALHGRTLAPGEDAPGQEPVVVLSRQLFERRWGGDLTLLGRQVLIDDVAHTVVGVLPEKFEFLDATVALWRPLTLGAEDRSRRAREDRDLVVVGRLAEGATLEGAREEVATLAATLAAEHPEVMNERGAHALRMRDSFPGPTDTALISLLMFAVGFVLLIACANVANLLLARGEARRQEIALRTALGAGKRRIVRQMLTESLLLALAGGVLGTLLAVGGVRFLVAAMPAQIPRSFVPALNFQVLAFTVAVSIVAGLVFGSVPSFLAARTDLAGTLREGGRDGTGSRRRGWLRSSLVVAQVTLAVVLLAGAAVLVRTFHSLQAAAPGFDTADLLTVQLALRGSDDPEEAAADGGRWATFFEEVERRTREVPGVRSVTAVNVLPRSRGGGPQASFTVDGVAVEPGDEPSTTWLVATPSYFATLAVPVRGRAFTAADHEDAARVAIVNRRFADKEFPGGDALGRRITILGESREVVGVSADVRQRRITARDGAAAAVYLPFRQAPRREMFLVLRAQSEPARLAAAVREAVWAVEPSQPVGQVLTMDEHVAEMMAGPRSISRVVTALGVLALALASIGIYGVMAYSVSLRRREIGVRMALGAGGGRITGMVTRQGLRLVAAGFLLAAPGTWGVLRFLESVFDSIPASDLAAAFALLAVLLASGFLASFLPARAAARVNPTETLRG